MSLEKICRQEQYLFYQSNQRILCGGNIDPLDNKILQILFLNARATNREIAESIDLSVSAVHKRIKALEEDKIITRYIARPSILAINSIPMVMIGRTKVAIDEALSELGAHDCIFGISVASGNILYISIMLRNISELQQITTFVTSTADLEDPIIGIVHEQYQENPVQLSEYELKIIKSLNQDARKSLNAVADEIGSSVKTVKKNLDTMIKEQKVNFTIQWAPLYRESFVSVLHITTSQEMDVNIHIRQLYKKYDSNMIVCVAFANVPNFILLELWTQTPRESQQIVNDLQVIYPEVIPHILLSIHWYPNWMDAMVQNIT